MAREDADRLVNLGVNPDRLVVTGNAKQESLSFRADQAQVLALRESLGLSGRPVWVAGSLRSGEEEMVVSAFKQVHREVPEAGSGGRAAPPGTGGGPGRDAGAGGPGVSPPLPAERFPA